MSRIAREHADEGLVVLAVNAWDEDKDVLAKFIKSEKLAQRVLLNGSDVGSEKYNVKGVPVVLWITPDGIIEDVEVGFGGRRSLEEKTRRLLSRGS